MKSSRVPRSTWEQGRVNLIVMNTCWLWGEELPFMQSSDEKKDDSFRRAKPGSVLPPRCMEEDRLRQWTQHHLLEHRLLSPPQSF